MHKCIKIQIKCQQNDRDNKLVVIIRGSIKDDSGAEDSNYDTCFACG